MIWKVQRLTDILKHFNFSYSAYDTYCKSQLWFYFSKIAKAKPSGKGFTIYGDVGNVVHNAVEDYIKTDTNTFYEHWLKYDIDNQKTINGRKLEQAKYYKMYEWLCDTFITLDKHLWKKSVAEYKLSLNLFGMNFKGYVDFYVENTDGSIIIFDWKTNGTYNYKMHRKQRLVYSWMLWKMKGVIPLCKWVYASGQSIIRDKFTVEELKDFELEIIVFIKDIQKKGFDVNNYEVGSYKNPFNQYYDLCKEQEQKRLDKPNQTITMNIRGNFVFFEGVVPDILKQGIDLRTRFDLPDKYFMQQAVRKRARGVVNIQDVGTVHLFNSRYNCFPIGLLDKITLVIQEYAKYYKKDVTVRLIDSRDKDVMEQKLNWAADELNTTKVLRHYQNEAVQTFLTKKSGIIQLPCGAGKTFTAAEIIRQIDGKTLWICDRKELSEQTKEVLEELLNVEVGVISGTLVDLDKPVTIATIQSLNSKLPSLLHYLSTVNMVVVDEMHKSAAESYQKVFAKLPNTKYRLGLSATSFRDDGKTPILHSILGDVIYKVTTQELIKQGFLVSPDIRFINMGFNFFDGKQTYPEDYKQNIVENAKRNDKIVDICLKYVDKKILILTKSVDHGKRLNLLIPGSKHIHGKLNDVKRGEYMAYFRESSSPVLIMTLSIGAEGLDIPDLGVIINASGNKGDVKSIQVLGRVLRLFKGKGEALYYDFLDSGCHTKGHSEARMAVFKEQGHNVQIVS